MIIEIKIKIYQRYIKYHTQNSQIYRAHIVQTLFLVKIPSSNSYYSSKFFLSASNAIIVVI